MVPAAFVETASLPLLPNGKVDRRALAASAQRGPARAIVPAANPIEAQLMRIWDDLIDIREIARDDNFFELGGHSLLLPRLMDRIRRDFGVTLPLGAIFESPTIRALAELIERRHPVREWRCLVGIRERGRRPPLYLVHGLGGEIGYFYNLAEYLHPEQPVYGLQSPAKPYDDLESMAAHYLDEIRRQQPEGPYLLGGYCVGGAVAYEMARRLVAAGEQVRFLALIDTLMPAPPPLARRLKRLASRPPREILTSVEAHARGVARRLLRPARGGPDLTFYGVPAAFQAIAALHYRAQERYVPRPYPGDVWIFRSRHEAYADDLGWGPLVGGRLEIRLVPGQHADVLKPPYIKESARQLAAAVDEVIAADP
jgi:thioesterase domain-containing protein